MGVKRFLIVGVVAVLAGLIAYDALVQREEGATNVDSVRRRPRQQIAQSAESAQEISQDRIDELARRGLGQPLPKSLEMAFVDENDHWLVTGSSKSEVRVPFVPGHLPDPPADLEPVAENPGFLGSQACAKCHEEKHSSFVHTAHHRTSRIATEETIDGSFEEGENEMATTNPELSIRMIRRDGGLFQRVRFSGWQFDVPFDLVTGSSIMGQTYLYWHDDRLFQMNVTCLSSHGNAWVNSPGFAEGNAKYERPITPRCLDCHVTYVDFRGEPNHYTPDTLVLGISCERCHGPGRDHVEFHTENPDAKQARDISLPSDLTRPQQLDLCGQCHGGLFPLKGKPFSFRPGDRLAQHYYPVATGTDNDGVHTSDQLARLSESQCFKQSEMTCIDCHNPHRQEKGMTKVFSAKCLKCHEVQHCGMSDQLGPSLADNCYDCHMPRYTSESRLQFRSIGKTVALELRDHKIRVDAEATRRFLESRSEQ